MDITRYGAFILIYEVIAKMARKKTWTQLTADHNIRGLPVVIFDVWLAVHLLRAFIRKHD